MNGRSPPSLLPAPLDPELDEDDEAELLEPCPPEEDDPDDDVDPEEPEPPDEPKTPEEPVSPAEPEDAEPASEVAEPALDARASLSDAGPELDIAIEPELPLPPSSPPTSDSFVESEPQAAIMRKSVTGLASRARRRLRKSGVSSLRTEWDTS